ncbi:response regulator transcription factor [Roseivivax isoporae]|uniref:LuxR family transcriptional regulator n=1 Tax=Roseivivax isoporae LMG 25204 TaxID=1449351 RepID=X7F7X5_9RHOB|nr:response regulator transcription factor [Roseivivax isoporae]ETX28838.1 LuxR family transcriptional regulator [Roseivivax isoporae LMG 25204]
MTAQDQGPVRLLIADDHAMVLEMFAQFISNLPDVTATTAPDLDAALALIDSEGPFDLVLVDLNMPGMNGLEGLGKAIARNGSKPVALLTSNPPAHLVPEVLAMGGAGFVLKTTSLSAFYNEIRFMANGGRYIPVELIEHRRVPPREQRDVPLSEREMQVLAELAVGKSNSAIGAALGLKEATIKMHVKSICTKLEASNRTQAVIVARDLELI